MSKDVRDNPYDKVRKPTAKGVRVIDGRKFNKQKEKEYEEDLIKDGIQEWEEEYKNGNYI